MISITTDKKDKWIKFMVNTIGKMEQQDIDAIGIVVIHEDASVSTTFFNCDTNDKMIMQGHIGIDITDDVIMDGIANGRYDWDALQIECELKDSEDNS